MDSWPADKTGTVDFEYKGEVYKTWYRLNGDLKCGKAPLICLHGGPGAPHQSILPLMDIAIEHNRPVIFYDQVGNGGSTHIKGALDSFWTYEIFMAEFENFVEKLGIADNYHCIGHSWGGMLAMMLLCSGRAKGMRRVISASGPASVPLTVEGMEGLLAQLPKEDAEMLLRHEREGTTDDPEYQAGMMVFYDKHVCRLNPWPAEFLEALHSAEANNQVYRVM